jgi:hypothetical protein
MTETPAIHPIVGVWLHTQEAFDASTQYTFTSDGTFTKQHRSWGTMQYYSEGTYTLDETTITLHTTTNVTGESTPGGPPTYIDFSALAGIQTPPLTYQWAITTTLEGTQLTLRTPSGTSWIPLIKQP